ncbi:bifunctional adenosylcobinamide kinase/adenosylcobinamide-phosphate guanylyltransferase [Devosia rhodophyticola]|uniref:Bifunctional adenosylcobalamin biosynthesis protein n=1 Tax=Devosia rhodophyticola TaxID=3026423 RepID=A0ABY7YYZ2_9HYPH|nr:bifunctional adenosylcobinamide kinase/adenosylcobinamide-phosphate guanylyltransferase [Devosia rhodophyticola]WDR06584.1 bifunctional adenosylcobinamide kinase/adenosylcobinamide-phosphate guanylyltransferase [Devosia rhodophyticola]
MARHVLILGGARSGKTGFAERFALGAGRRPAYLATAEAMDEEMRERVENHQRMRDQLFTTIEEPLDLPRALLAAAGDHDVILVDCLTLWISNLLGEGASVADAVDMLEAAMTQIDECRIILVSNEVGQGIVPDNALARMFRDLAGSTHQQLAEACSDVYFVTAGLPLTLKGQVVGASGRPVARS